MRLRWCLLERSFDKRSIDKVAKAQKRFNSIGSPLVLTVSKRMSLTNHTKGKGKVNA